MYILNNVSLDQGAAHKGAELQSERDLHMASGKDKECASPVRLLVPEPAHSQLQISFFITKNC